MALLPHSAVLVIGSKMKIRNLDYSENALNAEHARLGLPPLEHNVEHMALQAGPSRLIHAAAWLALVFLLLLISYFLLRLFSHGTAAAQDVLTQALHSELFWSAVAVGFLAQTVDGALGMAYGITSTTFLMASGISPAMASASVHIAEVFTTGVSGISHVKMGNVNKRLFLRLLVPGIIGAVVGAYILTNIDGKALKPYVSAYLLIMGFYIVSKVFRKIKTARGEPQHVAKLALFGGFIDAVGGGGWGPVVTTTLVGTGHDPRTTIGSVNFAEFFLTIASAAVFSLLVGTGPWLVVAGLVMGGLFSAPLAALLCSRLPTRALLAMVGTLIVVVSSYNLWSALH
jgi:uncharacterized protein